VGMGTSVWMRICIESGITRDVEMEFDRGSFSLNATIKKSN
jgi:hypothetical protein